MSDSRQTVLGFDYGTRWIGVAAGQTVTATATALPPLAARDGVPDWTQLGTLIEEWRPDILVVGLPLNMDDTASPLSERAKKFGRRLHGRFGIEVAYWDERLSSFEARGELLAQNRGRDFKKLGVDSLSARLILESWMRSLAGN